MSGNTGNGDIPNPFAWAAGGFPDDPFFAEVVLLLHCDGTNGSVVFPDSSPLHNTVLVTPDATVSTAQFVAGTGSASFPDTTGFPATAKLYVPFSAGDPLDILSDASGDFTIEGWFYAPNTNTNTGFYPFSYGGSYINALNGVTLEVIPNTPGTAFFRTVVHPAGWSAAGSGSATITLNTWHHFALTRASGTAMLFLDGVMQGPPVAGWNSYTAAANAAATFGIEPSLSGALEPFFLDEIRVTKGVARYVANFTPPVPPFSNF